MCLKVGLSAKPIQNGGEPITCWKVVRELEGIGKYKPFYYNGMETYVDGSTYCISDEDDFLAQKMEINLGFHSYANEEEAKNKFRLMQSPIWYGLEIPFCLIKCEIPTGAYYFKGVFSERKCYCSSKIKIVGKVC